MALVLDYVRRTDAFIDPHTDSVRGLPRPEDDAYAQQMAQADPVYAVWGREGIRCQVEGSCYR